MDHSSGSGGNASAAYLNQGIINGGAGGASTSGQGGTGSNGRSASNNYNYSGALTAGAGGAGRNPGGQQGTSGTPQP